MNESSIAVLLLMAVIVGILIGTLAAMVRRAWRVEQAPGAGPRRVHIEPSPLLGPTRNQRHVGRTYGTPALFGPTGSDITFRRYDTPPHGMPILTDTLVMPR